PLLKGPMPREPDRIAGTGLRRERHVAVDAGKDPGFQIGGLHLAVDAPSDQRQDRQRDRPAENPDAEEQRPGQRASVLFLRIALIRNTRVLARFAWASRI